MSLETQIAALVTAANNLTGAVSNKIASIDQKVAAATEQVPATVRAEVSKILYVDSAAGLDTNTGLTTDKPLKTIGAAINKVMSGGTAEIRLNRGKVYEVGASLGGNDVDRKAILFIPYGAAANKPTIRGVVMASPNGTICNAFEGKTDVSIKITDCRIETGLSPNGPVYTYLDYGGFFSRGGETGESVSFKVFLHRCDLYVQDVATFTTYFGFMQLSVALSAIYKNGAQAKIVDSAIPKIVDISTTSVSGYGASTTFEVLFSMNAGGYIARKSDSSINV